jgi:hypothetical protein
MACRGWWLRFAVPGFHGRINANDWYVMQYHS